MLNQQILWPFLYFQKLKMKNRFYILFCLCLLSFNISFSQKIFSTKFSSGSDLNVFVVEFESQADLKVYKVDYKSQARGNEGLWYFVDYQSQSDKKIFFVDYKSQSDLNIFFVKYKSKAGWRNSYKMHLLY